MSNFNVLFIGDIVGKEGRQVLKNNLKNIVDAEQINFVIANGENAAGGIGLSGSVYKELLNQNIQALTSGNHIYKQKEFVQNFDDFTKLIRPLNFPPGNPGRGYRFFQVGNVNIAVVNLIGRVFMQTYDCPFRKMTEALEDIKKVTPIILIDFHAEATSEKQAFAWYMAGKVSAVLGTHTHVQTADERILAGRTAYITDVGMAGPFNGIIGMKRDIIINRFLTQMPAKFELEADGELILNAVKVVIEPSTGKALEIKRLNYIYA